MRIRAIAFTCTVCLAAVAVSSAAEPSKKVDSPPAEPSSPTSNGLEMAEDLEIMGAVLRAALTKLYAPQAVRQYTGGRDSPPGYKPYGMSAPESRYPYYTRSGPSDYVAKLNEDPAQQIAQPATAGPHRTEAVRRPEAAYFGGYGVVYQITLDVPPPSQRQPKETAEDADGPSRGPGPWEIARRNLRGGPYAEPPRREKYRAPTQDDLVGKLLDVLAENAPHFRHLKSQDRLTVAITFPRGTGAAEPGDKSHTDLAKTAIQKAIMGSGPAGAMASGSAGSMKSGPAGGRSTHEVYGDLHMRQGNYQRAIKAYERWLGGPPMRKPPGEARRIYLKLAQAYTAAGELDSAQKAIALAMRYRKPEVGNASAPASRAIPLPARLIVSVPKSRLDEVAAGKMKREDLKGHATLDYFNPPATRPGLGSQRSMPLSSDAGDGGGMGMW